MQRAPVLEAFPEFGLFADLDEAVVAADDTATIVFANDATEELLGWSPLDLLGHPLEVLIPDRLVDPHRQGFARFTRGDELRFAGQPLRLSALCKDGTEVEVDIVLSTLERAGRRVVVATVREVEPPAQGGDPTAIADELAGLLHGSETFALTMSRLVATLGRRLGFDFAALWVPDERIDRLRCITVWETAPGVFPNFTGQTMQIAVRRDEGLPGRAWVSGVPVWSADITENERAFRAGSAAVDGLRGGLVFPVVADHEVMGVIEMYGVHARQLDPGLERSLVRVGAELGPVLHRRLVDEASKLERARLELALAAGDMGVWHWDLASNVISWSENLQAVLGRADEFVGSIDDFVAVVHPADRDRVMEGFQRAAEPAGPRDLRLEYRVVRDDGDVRWVEARGRALADDRNRLVALTGVATDVTDRKEGELARETAHARLDLALEAGRMGVWDWDVELDEVRMSVPLQLQFGFPPRAASAELRGFMHSDDRDRVSEQVAAALEREGRFQTECRVVRPDGQTRWIANRGIAIHDGSGKLVALTGVATDVTQQRVNQTQLRRKSQLLETLNEVGRAVTSHLDLDRVVQMVTDAATEMTGAQFGAFFYNAVDGHSEHYMLHAVSGADATAFHGFPMPRKTPLFEPTFSGTGVVRLDDVTTDPRYGQTAPHHGMPRGHLPVRSYLAVPVVGGDGEVFGGLFFGHRERGRFTEHSEALALGIAAQAAVAIANARLYAASQQEIAGRQRAYEERDAVARVLQASLLPPTLPESAYFTFGGRYVAGREMVGGDFYDVFPLGGRDWGMVMGDVCGKGPEAAAVTALARYTVRSAAVVESEPEDVLRFLNDAALRDQTVDRFCTASFARLHAVHRGLAALQFAHGGHPPALVLRAGGAVEPAPDTGMLLGVVPEPRIGHYATTLGAGDAAVLYTDGVTEARGPDGPLGLDGLVDLVRSLAGRSAQEIADAVVDEVGAYVGDGPRDDAAVLVAMVRDS